MGAEGFLSGREGVLGDTRLFQVVERPAGEGLRGRRALGLGGGQDIGDQVLGVGVQRQVTHQSHLRSGC